MSKKKRNMTAKKINIKKTRMTGSDHVVVSVGGMAEEAYSEELLMKYSSDLFKCCSISVMTDSSEDGRLHC